MAGTDVVSISSRMPSAFANSTTRPFFVGLDGSERLCVHVAQNKGVLSLKSRIGRDLKQAGIDSRFRVVRHRPSRLDRARSLEQFIAPAKGTGIVYDPTGAFDRARRLVAFSHELRRELGNRLGGVYWHSRLRTLVVVLDPRKYVNDSKVRIADLGFAEDCALRTLKSAWGEDDLGLVPVLRIGFELLDLPLVPVDTASYFSRRSLLSILRRNARIPVLGAMLGLGAAGAAAAADLPPAPDSEVILPAGSLPAVSEPNGKLSVFGGFRDRENVKSVEEGGVVGAYSIPIAHQYGFQIDGLLGLRDGDIAFGTAAHLFWRDPDKGLFGLTGSYVGWDADNNLGGYTDMTRIGVEGELYLEQFTLAAQSGVQFGANTRDGFFGRADLRWYSTPDLMFKVGGEYNEHNNGIARLGAEFQPGLEGMPGLSLFADAAVGDDDYVKVLAGVRIYFGRPKSLQDRHRLDDPGVALSDNASVIGNRNPKATAAAAAGGGAVSPPTSPPTSSPPPPPPPPPEGIG